MAQVDKVLQKVKENEAYMRERVSISIPKYPQHTEPLYVAVGDYQAIIPRGQYVSIPRFAAEVITQSQEQDAELTNQIEAMENRFRDKSKTF